MILPYWILLIAGLLPYTVVQVARGKSFDNSRPRDGYANAEGLQKRAYGAHVNSLEVFPFFAVAMLVALQAGMGGGLLNVLGIVWIALRVAYIYAYLKDMPKLRSPLWMLGMVVAIAILTLPLWGPYPEGL
jgi:uncharacterized MAPEG superfamily protein